MNAADVEDVLKRLISRPKVLEISVERRDRSSQEASFVPFAKVLQGALWTPKRGGGYEKASLPSSEDYQITFWHGSGSRATKVEIPSLNEFNKWLGDPAPARRQYRQDSQAQVNAGKDERNRVRQLLRIGGYKNRTFSFSGRGMSCPGCGFSYPSDKDPTLVQEVVRGHKRADCPTRIRMLQVVEQWDARPG